MIKLADVEKSYGAGEAKTEVLKGVSLEIGRGDLVAMIGQSGSGKSTLLNIIGGLDEADSGSVEVAGLDYARTSESDMARVRNHEIGFIFQAFNLLDHLDCLGNVTLPGAFSDDEGSDAEERGRKALERVGLGQLARRRPSELSGGQKQRVAIARALFNRPRLLLCDEPTGNLDRDTGREVIEFFKELNRDDGVTLLIVTHEARVSEAADRIIKIEDGVIIDDSHRKDAGQ
ncbi:MAG: ABC transporter ATP-binding protein [Deltaproteobacteria bacterium]|nr:ABC transporter ATP-binding protein [Deltaproteobacteria bacterium]